jgi:hypothetical protein
VTIYQRQPVPLTFLLTDSSGNPADAVATQPVCTVTAPDLTTSTPAVTNASTGTYTAPGPSGQAGHYTVAWACADATYPGGGTDSYNISAASELSILSFADAKRTLRIAATDTSEDDFIHEFNPAVTAVVEWYCGPVIQQAVTERLPAGGLTIQLSKPPVTGLTVWTTIPAALATAGIAVPNPASPMFPTRVFGVSYPLTQLYADPVLGTVTHTSGLPFYYGEYIWSYSAGRPVIPDCIIYGSRAILKHLFGIERGGGGGSASLGAADEETTMTPLGFAIPNRALEMMTPEKLPAAIA